ncbi:hypothetical protein [Bradyrhizobium sp. 142]|uniref:hypothetical protein n=1 Tax=Bradyrhizobium sp. 142 TaxID=2782618 RepID=UPI001FFBA239|nr:hypothetical protein [Bradyrhizobium sp. 142]MCK1724860.1 hypothetical protein [Bradyrhizobium sp. 142]
MTISGVLHDPASTLSSVIGFTVFPLFSGAKPPGRKTDHDKGQADNGCREFGGVFQTEEFDDGSARGAEKRFHDQAKQTLKHGDWSRPPSPGFN